MENRRKIIIRFIAIFGFMSLGFLAVLVQIGIIQTKERKQWIKLAQYQEPKEVVIDAVRGNIYDADGRLLAGSMPRYVLAMDMRTAALHQGGDTLFYNNLDSISVGLAKIFRDKSSQEYKRGLTDAFKRQDRYYKLQKKPVTYSQMKQVKALPLFRKGVMKSGLQTEERHQRVRPFGNLAKRSIGGVDPDTGEGKTGLESSFENTLAGVPGRSERLRIHGRTENIVITPSKDGKDIVTTIDANLQDLVESTLRQRLEKVDGEWGCCILMEVKTGEIKAISNLDKTSDGEYFEMNQHALQRVEPGSTFKPISLMATLEAGGINYKSDTFEVYKDGWTYNGATIYDAHALDTVLRARDAIAVSSNIALAKIVTEGFNHNAEKFVKRLRSMGIAEKVPFDIIGSDTAIIKVPKDRATLAKMSYGYSVELSPLHILTIYNGIANGGKMISPVLVKEVRKNGKVISTNKTKVLKSSMCSDKVLKQVKESLHAVVWDDHLGTAARYPWGARKVQSDVVSIAGKTGTAQIFENGRYNNHSHRISFVGYFPEENPQYSCICVIGKPHRPNDSGGDCGQVVRDVAIRTMAYTGSQKSNIKKLPYDSIQKPHIKAGPQKRAYTITRATGVKLSRSRKYEWTRVDSDMKVEQVEVLKDKVPDVRGMGARDAVYAIEQTGMTAQIQGRGRVVRQSELPGSEAKKGRTVYLDLR